MSKIIINTTKIKNKKVVFQRPECEMFLVKKIHSSACSVKHKGVKKLTRAVKFL